jgi:hypothetical protein
MAVSMSFAILTVMPDVQQGSCGEFAPVFNISTGRANGVNGFKVYAYFSVDSEDDQPELLDKNINITPKSRVKMQKLSAHVYRVLVDYSDYNMPGNVLLFPNANAIKFFSVTLKKSNMSTHCLRPYPWGQNHHNFVIESKNGTVLDGKHPDFKSRIGLPTKNTSTCKGRSSSAYPNEPIAIIRLDNEDDDGASKIKKGGDMNPNGIDVSHSSILFYYCVYEFSELPRAPYDYAVLKMDIQCPAGTYPVKRHHDCENSDPDNYGFGPIWPSKAGKDVDLEYCFVPRSSNSTLVYPFAGLLSNAMNTSIFANVSNSNLSHSEIYVDDEDKNNKNSWDYYGADWLKSRIEAIMSGKKNTTYHVVKWKGTYLAKSADEFAAPAVAENPLVVAAPLAPAIKGLDRSAVAVELKSEGKVKVSIVNVNGSVIANIAQESLQPGVHQIKWNSGMVPSGRYIVKIEQNGMVNAKNVILK